MPSRTAIATAAGAALLSLALLTGCSAVFPSGSVDSGGASDARPADASSQDGADEAAPQSQTSPVEDRALVTTGEMGLKTTDVAGVTVQVEELIASFDGRIDSRSENNAGGDDAITTYLTTRVPAGEYDALIDGLRDVADVEYLSTQVSDVTAETVDLDARITALEASVESLQAMLAAADNVDDMLAVEQTLSDREAELQSLRAQQTALADQVAMSTLSITISNDELANPSDSPGGFLGGLQAGWNALVAFFGGLLTVLGFLLPGLIVLVIIAAILFFGIRAIVRGRRSRTTVEAPTVPAGGLHSGAMQSGGTQPGTQAAPGHPTDAPNATESQHPGPRGRGDASLTVENEPRGAAPSDPHRVEGTDGAPGGNGPDSGRA